MKFFITFVPVSFSESLICVFYPETIVSMHIVKACFLFVIFSLISPHLYPVGINPRYASLMANGPAIKVTVNPDKNEPFELIVSSNISLSADSMATYPSDFNPKDTKAWIVVRNLTNNKSDTCYISVVPWVANLSELKIKKIIDERYAILGKTEDTLLFVYKNKLYKTGEDLNSRNYLSDFVLKSTDYYWGYLRTPAGSFIRNDKDIFYSVDERNWMLDYTTKGRGIRNSFSYTYDSISQTTHIFAHDYTVTGQDTFPHSVYRKTISPINKTQWEKVFTFYSKDQWAVDKSLFPACRHIHSLVTDPYTGHIWIGTGDLNQHSHIYYSDDNGNTWKHVGMGSQEWRVLSIWFTRGFVYWSMDTAAPPQKLFRISRNIYNKNGYWPDMSPIVSGGELKPNVRYMIGSFTEDNYYSKLGYKVGDIVFGNSSVIVNDGNSFFSLNDPVNDYREIVASLPNNALWNCVDVYDQRGDVVTIIPSNAEGQAIDNRPRIFGVKERADGSVDVQELLSTNRGKGVSSQFYPYEQDAMGNMYFQTYNMNFYFSQGLIQTQLIWNDFVDFKSGFLDAEEMEDVNTLLLSLKDCDADSVVWQVSKEKKIKWSNLTNADVKSKILKVYRDSANNYLYRALTFQKDKAPSASNYVRVEKEKRRTDNKNLRRDPLSFGISLINNENEKCIVIKCHDSIPEKVNIILYDLSGRAVYSNTHNFTLNNTFEAMLNNFQQGVYLLRIHGFKDYLTSKVVL
ncbi:hypothetical protein SDC9_50036 [bioreactor metagenome]|uniref:Secretion system C-terminal sorting domain-containing protein n=1 Tax=bioreactor metagenome TaxID=1076179 RepID=A0A644WJJ2_9ZZZZ